MNGRNAIPVALTIAGSDSGGGAGVQADLLTFAAHEVFGTSAITAVTAQNPGGVTLVSPLDPAAVREQIHQVHRFFRLSSLKTGMLYSREIINEVCNFLDEHHDLPAVVDPVMVSSSGAVLLKSDAVAAIQERLLSKAVLVTPNLDEVLVLLGSRPASRQAMLEAGVALARRHDTAFLVKGGHLPGDQVVDILVGPDGRSLEFAGERIDGVNTHGSGCTLSAAIAARLAAGFHLVDAVEGGIRYLRTTLQESLQTETGRFINHFPGGFFLAQGRETSEG